MSDEQLVPYEATFAGRRLNGDDKVRWSFVDSRDGHSYTYTKAVIPGATIGAVYLMHETDGGKSVRTRGEGAPRYVRSLPYDDPRVVQWRAADEAVVVEQARKAAIRKAADPWDEIERLVAAAVFGLSTAQRRALAVRLMERLWL